MKPTPAEKILTVASGLFFREGIRAVGVDRIIFEANIAKATFYRHFPSKEDLVLAYLGARHAGVIAGLDAVMAAETDPRRRIGTIFARLHDKARDPEFRGCAFALAVAEHSESGRVVGLARGHKRAVRDIFATILAEAPVADPGRLADHLALLYDGALARRAVTGAAGPMLDARDCALALYDLARQGRDLEMTQ